MKTICCYLLAIALSLSLISCEKSDLINNVSSANIASQLSETAPPKLIQQLKQNLMSYKPEVEILAPKSGTTLETTSTNVQLSVKDFPLFKDQKLGLGLNLHLILDNEPYIPIYNVEEPIKLEKLKAGTHTVRVIACLPWHESYKTQGAYAETTFNVLTETEDNYFDPDAPLLTYSSPTGNYGAEPIMLDFYIKDPSQKIFKSGELTSKSFAVKVTINDESFTLDRWQPIYLKGFKTGNNLIQLELIDSAGNEIDNTFNSPVRIITYNPNSSDPLAKIVTNQISLKEVQSIIDPNYYDELVEEPTVESREETELNFSTEDSPVIEKILELDKSDESVIKDPKLETLEKTEKDFSSTKLEKTELESTTSPFAKNTDSTKTETTMKSDIKIKVLDEPELEMSKSNEESNSINEIEMTNLD